MHNNFSIFRIGSLFPAPGQSAKFMQVYFLSTADQFARRRSIFDGLRPELIQILTDIMNEFNPYVSQFKSAVSTIRNSATPNLKVLPISFKFNSTITISQYMMGEEVSNLKQTEDCSKLQIWGCFLFFRLIINF